MKLSLPEKIRSLIVTFPGQLSCLRMKHNHEWIERGAGGPDNPLKIQAFLAILVRIPSKSQSYQASIQCWAIIGTPAKRHLMAVTGGPMMTR